MSDATTELDLDVQKISEVQHPGPPWFQWSDTPAHGGFIVEIGGKQTTLPYLCYREVKGKTYQYGTEGAERPIWAREVTLAPTEQPEGDWPSDDEVGYFNRDPSFNFVVNQAIDILDDPGLVAEVGRFRYLSNQMPVVLERSELIREMMDSLESYKDKVKNMNDQFTHEYYQCVERLKAGHARSRVEHAARSLAQSHQAGGRFYWPGVPGFRLHPCQYTFPQYRRERFLDDDDPVRPAAIDPSRAQAREMARMAKQEEKRTGARCKLCGEKGHFNKSCPKPHDRCTVRCEVRSDHPKYFPRTCNLPRGKGLRRGKYRRAEKEEDGNPDKDAEYEMDVV